MRQPVPFGKYLLLDRISVGGMAEVFKAKSYGVEGFEKVIAIKRILPSMGEDRDFIKMFIDEAKIAGQLAHANICQIFELGRIDGAHFIAMEYIWGKDLLQIQNRLKRRKELMDPAMACYVLAKVCEGLDYAHRKRDPMGNPLEIVHRDCSPQNVLVSYEGEVKIIDFGIAKAASRSSRTMAGVLKGKFGYMSPEQVRGLPLDRRSDIFALGTMLYESVTGARLFQGESDFSTLEKVRNVDIVPPRAVNAEVPQAVEDIVMRSLARDPEERYQSCGEMYADLQQYLMGLDQVFTAKSLGAWLKDGFARELGRERRLMEEYKKVGRDGLIAGVPQADAERDVVGVLGAAGSAEGDPTALGGPSFEDMVEDGAVPPVLAGAAVGAAEDEDDDEYGDDQPTEVFGEIDDADVIPLENTPPPSLAAQEPARRRPAPTSAPPPPPEASGAARWEQGGYGHGPRGVPEPARAVALGSGPNRPEDAHFFGTTASVTPLPTPSAIRALARRPSVAKDIAIGVGIAACVLALFAGGRYLLWGGESGEAAGEPMATGTIVVTVPDTRTASVYIDDALRGEVQDGAFTLEAIPVGAYEVSVRREGVAPCERSIELEPAKVQHINCHLDTGAPSGKLHLDGLERRHAVFVDGLPVAVTPGAPLELDPGKRHDIEVRDGSQVLLQFALELGSNEEVRRTVPAPAVARAGASAPREDEREDRSRSREDRREDDRETARGKDRAENGRRADDRRASPGEARKASASKERRKPETRVGYFMAYTTPWARVYIDGKDTGKMTPIAPRAKIPLSPGKHRITFVVGNEKFHYTALIEAGQDFKLATDLPVGR